MMFDHERIEELLAVRSLGGLDPDEERELASMRAEHDPACLECARFEREYGEVAGTLALALKPAPLRPGLEDRVVAMATDSLGDNVVSIATAPSGRTRREWPGRLVAGIAAALIALAAGATGYLVAPRGGSPQLTALGGLLSEPGARVVQLHGSGPGHVALAYRPGVDSAYLLGKDLEAAPSGKVYELWLMYASSGRPPEPVATFGEDGTGLIVTHLEANPGAARQVAVTVEKSPGSKKPTSAPIWIGSVTQ